MTCAVALNWLRVNSRNLCPVCGKPDWCLILEDGKASICARIESDKPVGNKGAGWLHTLDMARPLQLLKPILKAKQEPITSPDVLDKAYRALLQELSLSETHRENLQRRGLADAQAASLAYRTLPPNRRRELVNRLQSVNLAGVPGFYLEVGQWQLAGPTGILIPIRDVKRRIVGLQVRCDNAKV
ncbi:hypothetical protein ACFLTP_04495 [Chloroflexota bacterium]